MPVAQVQEFVSTGACARKVFAKDAKGKDVLVGFCTRPENHREKNCTHLLFDAPVRHVIHNIRV